jgi:hypothetical protein
VELRRTRNRWRGPPRGPRVCIIPLIGTEGCLCTEPDTESCGDRLSRDAETQVFDESFATQKCKCTDVSTFLCPIDQTHTRPPPSRMRSLYTIEDWPAGNPHGFQRHCPSCRLHTKSSSCRIPSSYMDLLPYGSNGKVAATIA